jgi:hypothetical protein
MINMKNCLEIQKKYSELAMKLLSLKSIGVNSATKKEALEIAKEIQSQVDDLREFMTELPIESSMLQYPKDVIGGVRYSIVVDHSRAFFEIKDDKEIYIDKFDWNYWESLANYDPDTLIPEDTSTYTALEKIVDNELPIVYPRETEIVRFYAIEFDEDVYEIDIKKLVTFMTLNNFRFATVQELFALKNKLKKSKDHKRLMIMPNSQIEAFLNKKRKYFDIVSFSNLDSSLSVSVEKVLKEIHDDSDDWESGRYSHLREKTGGSFFLFVKDTEPA